MSSIIDFKDLKVELIKQFDGTNNYFNCSHFNGKTLLRKEYKVNDNFHACDIVLDDGTTILKNYGDEEYYYSFEDARWIDDKNISVCVSHYDAKDLERHLKVRYKKYNIETKTFYHFITQKAIFEKHWQFYNNYIIYHINPYIILDENEQEVFVKHINWNPWADKYGEPGLSTNVFDVFGEKFLLFHSYIHYSRFVLKYFVGLMKLNNDATPIGYALNPFIISNREYTSDYVLNSLWKWRDLSNKFAVKYEVIFPMNVTTDDSSIHIYGGLNDCSAVKMSISKIDFVNKLKGQPFILY